MNHCAHGLCKNWELDFCRKLKGFPTKWHRRESCRTVFLLCGLQLASHVYVSGHDTTGVFVRDALLFVRRHRFNLLVKRRQLAGRSTNSGSTHAGASNNVKPSIERTVSTDRQARPPDPVSPHDVSEGLLATSHGGQAQLTSRSGVKRSTPETPGSGEAYVR